MPITNDILTTCLFNQNRFNNLTHTARMLLNKKSLICTPV